MPKLISIKKNDPASFKPIPVECIVCGEAGLAFDGVIGHYVCSKCLRCVEDNQCLVLETMYEDDTNVTISTRSMILNKDFVPNASKIIFIDHNSFSELYNKYKLKMN